MADERNNERKDKGASATSPEPTKATPAPVLPGMKGLPSDLNGQKGKEWSLKDHNGVIVHSTDDEAEIVRVFKVHSKLGEPNEANNYEGTPWTFIPFDPRLKNNAEFIAKQALIAKVKAKKNS